MSDGKPMAVGRHMTEDASWSRALEGATKAATVVALALPAIGVATRWLSYELGGLPSWLATVAPITDLAFAGLSAIWLAIPVGMAATLLAAGPPRRGSWVDRVGDRVFGHVVMVPWPIARLMNYGPWALIALTSSIAFLPMLLAGLLAGSRLGRWIASPDSERFREVAPSLLVALGLLAFSAGMAARTNDPQYIEQTGQVPPSQGWYSPLGEDGTFRYAYACAEGLTVAIPTTSITRITIGDPPRGEGSGSVAGLLLGRGWPRVGYQPGCPTAAPGAPAAPASPGPTPGA